MITLRTPRLLILSALLVFTFIPSLPANAIQLELGGSLSTIVVRVAEDTSTASSHVVALAAAKGVLVPYISLVGEERYFQTTRNWGWNYQVWASSFETDHQKVDGAISNEFGTSINGKYLYVTPLVFYRFGDRFANKPVRDWRVTLAMGFGVSYTEMEGDIRLSTSSSDTVMENTNVDTSSLYYSVSLLARATYKKFFISISNNAPQLRDNTNNLVFRISNVSYTLGYTFSFDFELPDVLQSP